MTRLTQLINSCVFAFLLQGDRGRQVFSYNFLLIFFFFNASCLYLLFFSFFREYVDQLQLYSTVSKIIFSYIFPFCYFNSTLQGLEGFRVSVSNVVTNFFFYSSLSERNISYLIACLFVIVEMLLLLSFLSN